eukprot:419463_1
MTSLTSNLLMSMLLLFQSAKPQRKACLPIDVCYHWTSSSWKYACDGTNYMIHMFHNANCSGVPEYSGNGTNAPETQLSVQTLLDDGWDYGDCGALCDNFIHYELLDVSNGSCDGSPSYAAEIIPIDSCKSKSTSTTSVKYTCELQTDIAIPDNSVHSMNVIKEHQYNSTDCSGTSNVVYYIANLCGYPNYTGTTARFECNEQYTLVGDNPKGMCRGNDWNVIDPNNKGYQTQPNCQELCDTDIACTAYDMDGPYDEHEVLYGCWLFYHIDIVAETGENDNGCYKKVNLNHNELDNNEINVTVVTSSNTRDTDSNINASENDVLDSNANANDVIIYAVIIGSIVVVVSIGLYFLIKYMSGNDNKNEQAQKNIDNKTTETQTQLSHAMTLGTTV